MSRLARATSVWVVAYGHDGPFQRHSWLCRWLNRGCRRSAVVGPNGAANPFGSVSCAQATSRPARGRPKYQGMKPISSRTLTGAVRSPRGTVL